MYTTLECFPAMRKDEILQFTETWMKLEDFMLSEANQNVKEKY